MFARASEAVDLLRKQGLKPTLINPRILSSVDKKCLDSLAGYRHVVTVEDGIVDGGFGQKVAAYLSPRGVKVTCLGLAKEFIDRYDVKELMEANGLTPEAIAATACK